MELDHHRREDGDRAEDVLRVRGELRRLWHEERHADARRLLERAADDLGRSPTFDVMGVRQELREREDGDRADIDDELRGQLGARLEGAVDGAEGQADVIVEAAIAAYEVGDRRLAERLIARLPDGVDATMDPNLMGPLLYVLGELLAARGRHAQAEEQFRAAIDLDPTLPNAYAGLAAVLVRRGNLRGAQDVVARGRERAREDEELQTLEADLAAVPERVRAALRGRSSPEAPGPRDRCWCGSARAAADCHGRA